MMSKILGIGTDLVELARLQRAYEKHGSRFLDRIFRPQEIKKRQGWALTQHLGGLFAAKEAALKALGTGWGQGLGIERLHLSISHEDRYAMAFVIAEGT